MSLKDKKITHLSQRIRALYDKERREKKPVRRFSLWSRRWMYMLYHEFLRDDVKVRAESLAFLMIFSLLPLIAGAFFVFTIFTKFAFVQEALNSSMEQVLSTIPDMHRAFVRDYVLHFKDQYLASMSEKSGILGIFALFILIWIGLQTFNNMDRMLNYIWSSDRVRPFFQQVRNFLFVSIAAPLVIVSGFSLPLILTKLGQTYPLLSSLPMISVVISSFLNPLLLFLTFTAVYRYVPVRPVRWRAAITGSIFSTVCFEIANALMRLYFHFGTTSAYGKAAVVPLIGFWIYIIWIIVILGAEVSFLMQNQKDIIFSNEVDPTLREGSALLAILATLLEAHTSGSNPVDFEDLRNATNLTSARLHTVLDFLMQKKAIIECIAVDGDLDGAYALGRDPKQIKLRDLLGVFFDSSDDNPNHALKKLWDKNLTEWLDSFENISLENVHK